MLAPKSIHFHNQSRIFTLAHIFIGVFKDPDSADVVFILHAIIFPSISQKDQKISLKQAYKTGAAHTTPLFEDLLSSRCWIPSIVVLLDNLTEGELFFLDSVEYFN